MPRPVGGLASAAAICHLATSATDLVCFLWTVCKTAETSPCVNLVIAPCIQFVGPTGKNGIHGRLDGVHSPAPAPERQRHSASWIPGCNKDVGLPRFRYFRTRFSLCVHPKNTNFMSSTEGAVIVVGTWIFLIGAVSMAVSELRAIRRAAEFTAAAAAAFVASHVHLEAVEEPPRPIADAPPRTTRTRPPPAA